MAIVLPNAALAVAMFVELAARGNRERYEHQRRHHPLDARAVPEIYADHWLRYGRTPLHVAAMLDHNVNVELILNSPRISVEVVNARDRFGYTPLHLAVRSGCLSTARLLTKSGWVLPDRLIAATCNGPDDLEQKCGDCKDEENCEYEGYTPLHVAVFAGNSQIVQLLLRRTCQVATGFDPISIHATTWKGKTPLDIAKEKGDPHLVELIESFDVAWMQSERERNANSVNAILVGAALVAAVTFNCWQQPPLGIPDPASYSHAESQDRTKLTAMFFMGVSLAFAFSVLALVVGTLAIMPSKGAALKTEVKHLRSSVRKASFLLVIAILCLMVAFHMGGALVYKIVAFAELGWFSTAANQIVHIVPIASLICISWLVFTMKGVYGWIILCLVLVFAIVAIIIHVLEHFVHLRVLLVGTKP